MPWPMAEAIAALFTGAASVFIIARLIGADEFGRSSIALGIILIMVVGVNSLVHDALVRMPDMQTEDRDTGLTASLVLAAVFMLLAAAASPLVARIYGDRHLGALILGFMPLLPLAAVSETLIAERRRALDFRSVARTQITGRVLGGCLGIAAAFLHAGAWSLVLQYVTISIYVAAVMLLRVKNRPRLRLSWVRLSPMLAFCGPIIGSQVMTQATGRLILLAIGHWHGLAFAGYWSAATRISENLFGGLMQAAYNVGLAHFSVKRDRHDMLAGLQEAQAVTAILSVPMLAALAAASEPLTRLLLGASWGPVSELMYGPLIVSFLQIRRMFPTTTLRAIGRSEFSLIVSLVELVTLTLAFIALGRLSPVAFSLVYPLGALAGSLPIFTLLVREFSTPPWQQLMLLLREAATGLLAFLAGKQAILLLPDKSVFTQLLAGGGVAFILAATLLILIDAGLVRRIAGVGAR